MVAGIPDKIRRPDQTLLAESSRGRRASRRASGRPGRARQEGQHPSSRQARGMRGAGTKHGGQGGHMLQTCRHADMGTRRGNHTPQPNQSPLVTVFCLSVVPACSILVPDSTPAPSSHSLTQFCCTTVRSAPSYSLRMNELSLLSCPPSARPLSSCLSLCDRLDIVHGPCVIPTTLQLRSHRAHRTCHCCGSTTLHSAVLGLILFSAGPTSQGRLQASDCDASIGRHQSGKSRA